MKIDEAIERQQRLCKSTILDPLPDYKEAVKLGIEALKRELEYRESMPPEAGELLPGETEE